MTLIIASTAEASESLSWWDLDWSNRVFLKVSESSGETLTGYDMRFELGPGDLDFSKADSRGCDLRFIDGGDELSYWVQEWDAGDETAIIWINIPCLSAGETKRIELYYSNPRAVCGYEGTNVSMDSVARAKLGPMIKVFEQDPLAEESENARSLRVTGVFLILFAVLLGSRFYLKRKRIPCAVMHACGICGANLTEKRRRCPVCGNKLS